MSEHQPYSSWDDKFQDLPLPDADAAWKKMDALLDKESGRRLPPPAAVAILPALGGSAGRAGCGRLVDL